VINYRQILFLLLILVGFPAYGEEREIYGASFKVDRITPAGGNLFEVNVSGQTRIVSEDGINRFIVDSYFKDGKRPGNFSPALLRNFTKAALEAHDQTAAERALGAVLRDSSVPSETAAEFVDQLSSFEETPEVFINVIGNLSEQPVAQSLFLEMVYALATFEPSWFELNASRWLSPVAPAAKDFFQKKFLQTLTPEKFEEGRNVLNRYAITFGQSDPLFAKLLGLYERVRLLFKDTKNGEISVVALFRSPDGLDPSLASAIVELIHNRSSQLINEKNPLLALALCAQIDPPLRTPTTFKLVANSLRAIVVPVSYAAVNVSIWDMLAELSAHDSAIRSAAIDFISAQLRSLFDRKQFNEINPWFLLLIRINPDPSELNNQLRFDWAAALQDDGNTSEALKRLDEIRSGFDISLFMRKIMLLIELRWGRILSLLILVCCAIAGTLIVKEKKKVEKEKEFVLEQEFIPQFVKQQGAREHPYLREYKECLGVLGLEIGTSAKQIKTSYRKLIKQVHPDTVGESNPTATKKFLQLQKAYDRILELDKEWEFTKR
jgi:DnaJ-domain-containing protein 1